MKKNFLKFIKKKLQPEKSFSILGEDILIKSFFNPEYIGNYVDIGCGRPISANNTFLFYKKGWRGLLIDPHNDIYKTKEKRTEDIVLNSCIKDIKNKEKKAILFYRKKWLELSSIDKKNFDFMNIFFKDHMEEDEEILKKEVNLIDANDIKNIFKIKNIDILSLDIEMNCENIVLDFIQILVNLFHP